MSPPSWLCAAVSAICWWCSNVSSTSVISLKGLGNLATIALIHFINKNEKYQIISTAAVETVGYRQSFYSSVYSRLSIMCMCVHVCVCVCVCARERERERERVCMHVCVCGCVCVCVYWYCEVSWAPRGHHMRRMDTLQFSFIIGTSAHWLIIQINAVWCCCCQNKMCKFETFP